MAEHQLVDRRIHTVHSEPIGICEGGMSAACEIATS
jgi:hypothetical protein